jgi:ribosomal protein S27E
VCPSCRHRQAFGNDAKRLTCERCHASATLAWDELS